MTTHTQATNLTRGHGIALFDQWTAIWNGELTLAARTLTPGFRIHFGGVSSADTDAFRGPAQLAAYIGEFRDRYPAPGLRYAVDGAPVVDPVTGYVVARWTVDVPDTAGATTTKSGIDMLAVAGDRIAEVWSVTGARRFAP
ncbi:nuclear transport factor 2 family protein [Streptantibioticus ferralitis]|uniref:Nuclear transport factor 2 family protein n=1 Tax=Streptantibioticus ferralitis TaxID=236510 RepID=A0ABT5Z2Y0_9ACTN|nr:nuclear transport factor 2 family protein [Streptantibioticus ferralitis]MDF2258188.1 nuclear transport factor 2 family protein [Streptantibioticus ferralitis]